MLFTWFRSRHDLRFFEKRVNTVVFCVHQDQKKMFEKCKKWYNLQGFGAVTGKKLHKYQRFGVQKLPKHRYLQCFVPATFSWKCKNLVNTRIFCDQPAKNAVIYSILVLCFQKHWYLQCFVHLWLVFTAFSAFLHGSRKNNFKTQKCCNLQHFVNFEKSKIVRKMCQNGTFSDFRYPKCGGGLCSWRRLWATRIPSKKLPPQQSERIFGVFRGPGSEGRRFGARLTIEL